MVETLGLGETQKEMQNELLIWDANVWGNEKGPRVFRVVVPGGD